MGQGYLCTFECKILGPQNVLAYQKLQILGMYEGEQKKTGPGIDTTPRSDKNLTKKGSFSASMTICSVNIPCILQVYL